MIYSLDFAVKEKDSFTFLSVDRIESDDLLNLLAQFILVVATVQKKYYKEQIRQTMIDDDIPF